MKFATGPLAIFNILINLGFPLWRSTHDKKMLGHKVKIVISARSFSNTMANPFVPPR